MSSAVVVLPGDGIGPEVTAQATRVLEDVAEKLGFSLEIREALLGGAAFDAVGQPLPEETLALCRDADAIFLGAVGGPQWDDLHAKVRPEDGILSLRKGLGLFANLRPCKVYPQLIDSSPLRPERLVDVDFIMVRELTGGLYFGKPKRRWENSRGRRAVDTLAYSEKEIERVVRIAFELARDRKKRVHSLDKMNVMESSRLWREVASEVGVEYPDVELIHMLADNAAMQLITNPSVFDVIVAENLFGDILSDEAAVIGGSLGMLPSASVSSLPPKHGRRRRGGKPALYEPIHGSAPDIAGKSLSNPMASILSAAMLLRLSLGLRAEAEAIENGIDSLLSEGYRTDDIASNGERPLTTSQVGDMVAGLVVG